jgi:hypothetical protein
MKTIKRGAIVLFAVVAITAILSADELVAQCPPNSPDCVQFDVFNVWILRDPITGQFPTYDGAGNSVYDYRVDCVSRKVNFVDTLIPYVVNPGDYNGESIFPFSNIKTYFGTDGINWTETPYWLFLNGAGDDNFGKNIDIYHVLKIKIGLSPTFYFRIKIDKSQNTGSSETAMLLRTGVGLKDGAILGVAPPGPPQLPSLKVKNLVIEGMNVKLSIDTNQCVQTASMCDDNFQICYPLETVTLTAKSSDGRITDTTIREIGDLDGNMICNWGRIFLADSPGCTSIPAGNGKYFLVGTTCKCTASSQCYPPKTCQPTGYCGP